MVDIMTVKTDKEYKAYEEAEVKEDFDGICKDALSGIKHERKYLSIIWNKDWSSIRDRLGTEGVDDREWYKRGIRQHRANLFEEGG